MQGAWIEIAGRRPLLDLEPSLPVQGAWIEMLNWQTSGQKVESLPVQGAWIEIMLVPPVSIRTICRSPCRERGLKSFLPFFVGSYGRVAPRAGSVD